MDLGRVEKALVVKHVALHPLLLLKKLKVVPEVVGGSFTLAMLSTLSGSLWPVS